MPEAKKRFDAGKTIQEKANVLWDVANSLAGLYKPHEYGLVILPMAVVKRFHDCLLPTYAKVQKEYAAKLTAEFGPGYTRSNLRNMRQFFLMFPICHAVKRAAIEEAMALRALPPPQREEGGE